METFSKLLPLPKAVFPPPLLANLTLTTPLILAQNCPASYVHRTSHSYTHNPTRAAIAITTSHRLVVWAMGGKKIDIPLAGAEGRRLIDAVGIVVEGGDRVVFLVKMGVAGVGTVGDTLEIKVRCDCAERIGEIVQGCREGYRLGTGQASLVVAAASQVNRGESIDGQTIHGERHRLQDRQLHRQQSRPTNNAPDYAGPQQALLQQPHSNLTEQVIHERRNIEQTDPLPSTHSPYEQDAPLNDPQMQQVRTQIAPGGAREPRRFSIQRKPVPDAVI